MLRISTLLLLIALTGAAQATESGWALLREGGHVVLIRSAMAPGTGEPHNFEIDKCRTQRNLSERGRQQARKIGALIAARAAPVELVLTSRYCRTRETARLAFGDSEDFTPLDPPSEDEDERAVQIEAILQEIRDYSGSGNLILVTHLETIKALTGEPAREGEAVIVRPDEEKLHILGRIIFN
jgi:phosphohistidine phosphatase SixA